MNVQLLFLLALAGPFCAFTHASPTALPTEYTAGFTDEPDKIQSTAEAEREDFTVATGPPAPEPEAHPEEVATQVATQVFTEAEPTADPLVTEEPVAETEAATAAAAATAAPEPLLTDPPAVEPAAPTEQEKSEVQPVPTGAVATENDDKVVIETNDDTEAGLSSGQVAGIVIGSLLAVVIVIAVVIAAVRRMGKYSSAKNKKPAKKDAVVSPLKKKSAKQQERPKFWKF